MIKALFVDLGYTLTYNNKHILYKKALNNLGYEFTTNEVDLAFHLADKHIMRYFSKLFMMNSKKYVDLYLGMVNYFLGVVEEPKEFVNEYRKQIAQHGLKWELFDEVTSTITKLKENGIKIILVSNWDESCRKVLKSLNLDTQLDDFVISSEVNCEKPEIGIFEEALKKANCKKEECLFVGDNYYDDGVGSQRFGIPYVIINRFHGKGMEELQEKTIASFNEVPKVIERLQHV